MPAADPPKKPQKRFQFIDNSNATGSNSTQVRRHVMQEYMREKRWQARAKANATTETEMPERKKSTVATSRSRSTRRRGRQQHPQVPSRETSGSEAALSSRASSAELEAAAKKGAEPLYPYTPNPSPTPKTSMTSFRLGSSAFAKIADLTPHAPFSPPSTIISSDSSSPDGRPRSSLLGFSSSSSSSSSPEPQSVLSAARTDPFDCLPMTLSLQDQELFDFYATVMPACSYGFERRSPHAHNWYLSVFIPEAMKGAVCFQNTILVHAANTQAWVKGLAETALSIEHRAKASQLLLHHYQRHPHDTSDATISATISAAALEDFDPRLERRQYAWMHWQAVVEKIRNRGGPAALVQHHRLQMLINWSDYILSGYNSHGATFYFDHPSSPPHANAHEARAIARVEVEEQCTEFITFLRCAEHLALVHAGVQHNPVSRNQQPFRYSAFLPDQPLYNLLASPNGPRYTQTGQFKQIISRLAALMTINTAIWEYRHSPELGEQFLVELVTNILLNDLDQHLSVEALIQILLSGSVNPLLQHSERPWFVGRMLKIAKRLSRPNFERLNDLLLQFLTLPPGLEPTVMDWEDDLRAEILHAPLVSYRSRFMMEPTP